MTLLSFVEELTELDRSLAVLNRTEPEQFTSLLKATFPERDLLSVERAVEDADDDVVVLIEDGKPIALVAHEVEPRTWRGFWTCDPDRVQRITRYVERTL